MANDDPWGLNGPGGSKTTTKPASKPSGSASDPWGLSGSGKASGGQKAPSSRTQTYSGEVQNTYTPPPKHRSLFGSILHDAGAPVRLAHRAASDTAHLVEGVPRGMAELGKEAAQGLGVDTGHGVGNLLKSLVVGVPDKSVGTAKTPAEKVQQLIAPGSIPKPLPGESNAGAQARVFPGVASMAQGITTTAHHLNPVELPQTLRDYATHPVSSLVNDTANLSLVLGPLAKATAGAGEAADAAKAAGEAGTLGGRAASGLQRAAAITNRIANAPAEAWKLPFRAPGALGELGAKSIQDAEIANQAGERGARPFTGARLLTPLSPASQSIKNLLSAGNAAIDEGRQQPLKLAASVRTELPSTTEQAAYRLVSEGVAPILSQLRDAIGPDKFEHHINQRYKGELTPEVANLAADVAAGKTPELAARIAEAQHLEQTAPLIQGGQAARAEQFYAQPGHAWQAGFAPSEAGISEATAPAEAKLGEARTAAERLRTRALGLRAQADAFEPRMGTTPPTLPVERAATRLQRATDAVNRAKATTAQAENDIVRSAAEKDLRASRSALVDEVRNYRRAVRDALQRQAADLEAARPDIGKPAPVSRDHPMHDVAEQIREQIGHGTANLGFFGGRQGQPLDSWLENWNEHRQVVPAVRSGEDYAAIARDAADHFQAVRNLRAQGRGLIAHGTANLHLAEGDPLAEVYLQGTPQEAAAALENARPGQLEAGAQQAADARLASAYERVGRHLAGEDVGPLSAHERALIAEQRTAPRLPAAEADLASARQQVNERLLTKGAQRGAVEQKARVMENLATSAESRVARLAKAAEAARATAAYELKNQPARLRPALSEGRAAQQAMVAVVNDLRGRGLHDQAARVEEAMKGVPTTSGQLQAAGINPLHSFHTQESKGTAIGRKRFSIPNPGKAGSERLRTGSPVYDRSPGGQARGAAELNRVTAMRATRDLIAKLPAAARLGEGPLAEATTAAEAKALGYEPMPGISNAGKLTELDTKLGLAKDTPFLPKYLLDEYRTYFGGHAKGEDLARFIGLGNRPFYMARLALNPAFITGRILGHAMLGFAQTSNPAELAANIVRAVKEWKRTGEFAGGPQLIKGAATSAEQAYDEAAAGGFKGKVGSVARGLTRVQRGPYRLAAFMDNAERSAFYLTELKRTGSPEMALTTALRALGDFHRLTPFEQTVVRQFIPMYNWHKTLTQIAFHLAEDHPLRLAWTLHLADTFGTPAFPLSDFNNASIPVGRDLVSTGLLNPFAEVTNDFGGGLGGAGKLLGPIPRLAVTNLITHTNPTTGKDYFMPPGTRTVQGHPAPPSLLTQLAALTPQKRLFDAVTGRDQVIRYANGQPYLPGAKAGEVPRPVPTGQTPLQGIASILGVGLTNRLAAEKQQGKSIAKAETAKTAAARAAENYRRRAKAARTGTKYVPLPPLTRSTSKPKAKAADNPWGI